MDRTALYRESEGRIVYTLRRGKDRPLADVRVLPCEARDVFKGGKP